MEHGPMKSHMPCWITRRRMALSFRLGGRALAVALACCVCILPAQQIPQTAAMTSTVVDPDGAPIPRAELSLEDTTIAGPVTRMETDATGSFRLQLETGHTY